MALLVIGSIVVGAVLGFPPGWIAGFEVLEEAPDHTMRTVEREQREARQDVPGG